MPAWIARTGYTGEDGFEIFCAAQDAAALWDALLERGRAAGGKPVGPRRARHAAPRGAAAALRQRHRRRDHAARGGARLGREARQRRLHRRDALRAQKAAGVTRKLVGFEMTGRGIARHGYPILDDAGAAGRARSPRAAPGADAGQEHRPRLCPGAARRCRARAFRSIAAASASTPTWSRPRSTSEERSNERAAVSRTTSTTRRTTSGRARGPRRASRWPPSASPRFAVEQLGDITQVDLPKEGETVKQAEVFGTVESVKAVSDLFAPITGKVVKVNSPLADSPEYVNEDPYGEGWMIEVERSATRRSSKGSWTPRRTRRSCASTENSRAWA